MEADSFFVCVDKAAVMEVAAPADALLALFHLIFVHDVSYPPMPKTIEYLER